MDFTIKAPFKVRSPDWSDINERLTMFAALLEINAWKDDRANFLNQLSSIYRFGLGTLRAAGSFSIFLGMSIYGIGQVTVDSIKKLGRHVYAVSRKTEREGRKNLKDKKLGYPYVATFATIAVSGFARRRLFNIHSHRRRQREFWGDVPHANFHKKWLPRFSAAVVSLCVLGSASAFSNLSVQTPVHSSTATIADSTCIIQRLNVVDSQHRLLIQRARAVGFDNGTPFDKRQLVANLCVALRHSQARPIANLVDPPVFGKERSPFGKFVLSLDSDVIKAQNAISLAMASTEETVASIEEERARNAYVPKPVGVQLADHRSPPIKRRSDKSRPVKAVAEEPTPAAVITYIPNTEPKHKPGS